MWQELQYGGCFASAREVVSSSDAGAVRVSSVSGQENLRTEGQLPPTPATASRRDNVWILRYGIQGRKVLGGTYFSTPRYVVTSIHYTRQVRPRKPNWFPKKTMSVLDCTFTIGVTYYIPCCIDSFIFKIIDNYKHVIHGVLRRVQFQQLFYLKTNTEVFFNLTTLSFNCSDDL